MPANQPALYFIFDRTTLIGRDTNEMDRETTIRDIMDDQVYRPVRVFSAEDGRWNDVSEDIAREIAHRLIGEEDVRGDLIEFIELHAGIRLANTLRAA